MYGSDNLKVDSLEKEYHHLIQYDSSLQMDLDMESQRIKPLYMGEADVKITLLLLQVMLSVEVMLLILG